MACQKLISVCHGAAAFKLWAPEIQEVNGWG
jgi:hypothetical protein